MSTKSTRKYDVQAGWSGNRQSVAILQTPPIPAVPDMRLDDDAAAVDRIRISTNSHDQGFSSFPEFHHTREASSSWFELAIVRIATQSTCGLTDGDPTPLPGSLPAADDAERSHRAPTVPTYETIRRIRLHSNLHASREFASHAVEVVRAGDRTTETDEDREQREFLDSLRTGDRLVLYALAQYPAWSNVVREGRIDVAMRAL
ncbi:hypothetical protein JCM11491_000134 [Sporobolomyces phaffii]